MCGKNAPYADNAEYPYQFFGYFSTFLGCGALDRLVHQQQAVFFRKVADYFQILYLCGKSAGVYARFFFFGEVGEYKVGSAYDTFLRRHVKACLSKQEAQSQTTYKGGLSAVVCTC